jgi:prepilin-type N-terminal cleavage/methylation domain-containing protein/prepilin-type processing-associated H-X9-DG protein
MLWLCLAIRRRTWLGLDGRRFRWGFTLVELLVVIAVIAVLAALLLPVLSRAKATAQAASCLNNLKQWGLATQLYASDNADCLPREGLPNPQADQGQLEPTNKAWYVQLPAELNLPFYRDMPWRTNASVGNAGTIWLCPANSRRCDASGKSNNLFHYCLNEAFDGTGVNDRLDSTLSSYRKPALIVWLFDSKNLPAIGEQNFVHTNLHNRGAQFLFLDGHVRRFRNSEYWNFSTGKGITNNPELVWSP